MHIHKFADLAVFDEVGVGGTLPATAEYREFIKKLHPAQILTGRLTTPLLEVTYSYMTNRGNYKVAKNTFCCVLFMRRWILKLTWNCATGQTHKTKRTHIGESPTYKFWRLT